MGIYILPEVPPRMSWESKFQVITPIRAIASYLKAPHYSLESLTQNIVRHRGMGVASALLSRRLLQNVVREVIDTKDIEGTAKAFLGTIKELFRSGVELTKLQASLEPRIQQLGNLAAAYRHQLRQVKRIDAAELYWQGAIQIAYQKAYIFYGYFTPGQDELALINAIAGQDSILVLPLDDLYPQNHQALSWLQSQGWELLAGKSANITAINHQLRQCFRDFKQTSPLPSGVKLNVYPNLEQEVRGVLTQAKVLQSQGVAAQDMVLVTREPQLYGETLINLAWEYNLSVQLSYEVPLEQTRLGAWIKLLLKVMRDNFPFEATAKLLSHPLAKYLSAKIWKQARETHPQGLNAWQELGVDLSLLDLKTSHPRNWVNRLLEILSAWNVLENAKSWAREILAYYRLQSGLKELSKNGAHNYSKQAFYQEISEILALLTIPAQPGQGGIELHCPTSILGTHYSYVFILGCGAGILPAAIADDPSLDFHSRKQLAKQGLNIATAVELASQETFDFYNLLNVPTEQISFSYPELIERNCVIASPYLARLGLKPSPVENLPIASIEQARQLYLRQPNLWKSDSSWLMPEIAHALKVESNRETAIAPDQYDGVIGISIDPQSKIFSASQLTQLGQCPFKWFSRRLLRLKELIEAESDLVAAMRGNLYHRCLELSLTGIKTASDLAQFNQEQLAQAFATAEQELKLTELSGWKFQRQEHLNLLTLNLASAEFLPPAREVIATETKFAMQWHGLQIKGQVDRIDRTPTGLNIIDYKTSGATPAGVKDATGKANLDIQLAVYQDAIAQQYPEAVIDTAAYYSLTKQKTINRPQKDPAELAAFAQQVKSHLTQGHYPVAPDADRKACRYCDYDLICRQGDRLKRKNQDLP
ncbi:MAG: PD-(D/E)XK nuclease family protein [Pleurocapsa sp. SU_5_0]|nr:PD-(D/E)XK nuclease family protein [Pleurocapsa sp. SU_5_0]